MTPRRRTGRRAKAAANARQVLAAGPWVGVKDSPDPYDDEPNQLVGATNCYIPDPEGGSGLYARPGMLLLNGSNQLGSGYQGQCVYGEIYSGTVYNFAFCNGKVYRVSTAFGTFTDVTPSGPTISTSARIKAIQFAGTLVVTDGVNTPWIGTNLSSTPITGTNINVDGSSTAFAANDVTVWGGSLVFMCSTAPAGSSLVSGVAAVWSEPNQPTVGYIQSGYTDYWNLIQDGTQPVNCIKGTNVGLYYWRASSIGLLPGPSPYNVTTTSTTDAIATNVGSQSPRSVRQYADYLYFVDSFGKPYRFPLGGRISDDPNESTWLWLNMRGAVQAATTTYPVVTGQMATAEIEQNLGLYIVAIWSPTPSAGTWPTNAYAFDARTGQYVGPWQIGTGFNIEQLGTLVDGNKMPYLCSLGSKTVTSSSGQGGYLWRLTNTGEGVWKDNSVVPVITATTQRLGYQAGVTWNADRLRFVALSQAQVAVTVTTPYGSAAAQASPTPAASNDATYVGVCGLNVRAARGMEFTLTPQTADSQWSLQRIEVEAVAQQARPEDA